MGAEESDDGDQWLGEMTDTDAGESGPSGSAADDADQSTDQWEWVCADDPQTDREDGPRDWERVWNRFADGELDTSAGNDASRPEAGADGEDETPVGTEGPDGTEAETDGTARRRNRSEREPPAPTSADTPSGEGADANRRSDDTGGPPPPPTAQRRPEDADAPLGSARRDIREMQPLYKRRTREFYLLWLAAALAYGLGDMVTTSVVFVVPRVGESNPVIALVLDQFGLVGFVAAKLVVFAVLLVISVKGGVDDDRVAYYGPPMLAILVGVGLTVWNLATLLSL